jgi:hypothetical protein
MGEESSIGTSQQGAIASIGGGKGVDLSTSDLGSFTPQGMEEDPYKGLAKPSDFEAYNKSFYQPPVYGNDALYPGMGEGIGVGNFSSQTTGSQTIYAPTGQYMPYDILQKREKALQEAAALRQQRLSSLKLPTAPILANPNYQRGLDNKFVSVIDKYKNEAQSLFGDNWITVLTDPNAPETDIRRRFQQDLRAFDILKNKTDILTNKAAEVLSDKEGIYARKTFDLAKNFNSAIQEFEHGDPTKINVTADQFLGSVDLSKYLHDEIFPSLKPAIEEWEKVGEEGDYEVKRAGLTSSVEAQAEGIAKRLKQEGGRYADVDYVTEEDIKNAIMDQFGAHTKKVESKTTSAKALKYISEGSGSDEDASNRLNKLNIITNPLKGISLKGVKLSDGTTYKRNETQLTNDLNNSKAAAALGVLIGADYQGGKVKTAEYRVKNIDGTMVPYVYLELTKFKQDEFGNVVQDAEPGKILINLNDTKSMSELNTIFNSSKSEKKITQDQLEKVSGSIKQEVKPVLGETKAKEELLTREELKSKGEGYAAKKRAEEVTVKVKEEPKKKTVTKKFTEVQEKNISLVLKNNPGATRSEVIEALGY